ncbi:MAG TPA: PIG-L family deacetylase [Gemmatimonadaceae bacterium]
MTRKCLLAFAAATLLAAATRTVSAQVASRPPSPDRSTAQLRRSLDGLTTTARVLIVGMHPDDELPELSTYLSLGKHVETAYLSVTRGEAGEDFNGTEGGTTLGVLRVAESLNARRVDGAHQYFTRAYDFGPVRTANDVFLRPVNDSEVTGHWDRDSIVGDVVTIIRAFRPHVIVGVQGDTIVAGNGQHLALTSLLNIAFAAAGDSTRYRDRQFGSPWPTAKLYRVGTGIRIATSGLDRVSGRTYTSIARDVRAQQRTQGPTVIAHAVSDTVGLELIASRVNRDAPDSSLFDAVDTTFARLGRGTTSQLGVVVRRLTVLADSLRSAVDISRPGASARSLAQVVQLARDARRFVNSCGHVNASPSISVAPIRSGYVCTPSELDRDATMDLVRDRANDALLAAAGVEITALSDRELLATHDTANVTVTITNHGAESVHVGTIAVHGALVDTARRAAFDVPPNSSVVMQRRVLHLLTLEPWWLGRRVADRFPDMMWPRDALIRDGTTSALLVSAASIPEEIRRATDVSYLLEIDGTAMTGNIGPVLYRYSDANVGTQYRQLAGIPDVTLRFARDLDWILIAKPVSRILRVKAKSNSDSPILIGLGKGTDPGIDVSAVPKELKLAPHEQREIVVPLRGHVAKERLGQFILWGSTADTTYQFGIQELTRDYLEPTRLLKASGEFLQSVDITVPANLTVLYVPEGVDDIRSALTQVGAFAREVSPDVLLTADLTHVSTIVLAPHSVERFPELAAQSARLLEFVRNGGALVIQRGGDTTVTSTLLPYPVSNGKPAQAVLQPGAPVKVLDPQSRLLNWPNRIQPKDWNSWVTGRAESIPTSADPRYQRVIETHDPDQPANTNAILVAHIGKGTLIYTSLTLDQQIAGGKGGALRLFVNMLSAGLPR